MKQNSAKSVAWLMAGFVLLAACSSDKDKKSENPDMEMHQQQMSETYVDTMVLHQTEFNKQIVCNGRLRAKAKSELNFKSQGIIAAVCVKEGQHVGKGTLIATLDRLDRERELDELLAPMKGKVEFFFNDESRYDTEFMDYKMNVVIVNSLEEALDHIDQHGSGHSEAIVTEDEAAARKFQAHVDAACVYWNAPTSFTDGAQFGLGAEIGISTQKLGPRGPMALEEICTYKWLIEGEGQTRP